MGSIDDSGGSLSNAPHYCTLRINKTNSSGNANGHCDGQPGEKDAGASRESDVTRLGQFCTIRGPPKGRTPATMGNTSSVAEGEDTRGELDRSLLYEENMCTFENICERSLEDRGEDVETGGEGIGNFCTLRKKRSAGQKVEDQLNGDSGGSDRGNGEGGVRETSLVEGEAANPPVGSYCTMKKKKLKLNQKFVESFLEDPNAKLHDYLSELDAYLDEIDGLDFEGLSSDDDETVGTDEVAKEEIVEENNYAVEKVEETSAQPSDSFRYIDIENFCTLPKRKRVQFLNAFQRACPLRRTIAASGQHSSNKETDTKLRPHRAEVIAEVDESSSSSAAATAAAADRDSVGAENGNSRERSRSITHQSEPTSTETLDRRPRRASTWLRNSMRKTRPITLPDHHFDPPETPQNASPDDSINASLSTVCTDLASMPHHDQQESLHSHEDYNELSSITTLPASELDPPTQETITTESYQQTEPSPPSTPLPSAPITEEDLIPYFVSASLHDRTVDLPPPPPLETNLDSPTQMNRPRQTGRRSEVRPRVVAITAERDALTNQLIIRTSTSPNQRIGSNGSSSSFRQQQRPNAHHNHRQQSAHHHHQHHHHHHNRYGGMGSETSSIGSSRNPSPVSLLSTTTFSSIASERPHSRPSDDGSRRGGGDVTSLAIGTESTMTAANTGTNAATTRNGSLHSTAITIGNHATVDDDSDSSDDDESVPEMDRNGRPKPQWPHMLSRAMACSFCTLGLFNMSRFAIFSIHFGANFIVQFLIFSFLFGIPMLWLQMVLGSRVRGGPVTMWRISPICKGIGIALILAQGLISLYSAISLSWVLVYFRDSLVSRSEKYRWQEIFEMYRGPGNQSFRLSDTVADYFNGVVLQRHQLGPGVRGTNGIGAVRFQLAFNLAILWTFVFVVLCKGIRSFGKIVIGVFSCGFIGLIAVTSKFLSMVNYDSIKNVFPATDWADFFINSKSWMSAAQETFLTWGLLGVSVYSISCRTNRKGGSRRSKRELRRDALLVVVVTLTGLMLAAAFGSACVQILNNRGYYYFPGSYENIGTDIFLLPADQPLPPQHANMPTKWLIRYSMVLGESFKRPYANPHQESGYQVLRLVTELFPSTLAAATQEHIAPIWSLLGFLTLLMFGLGQLCAMWKPIAGAIGDSPSSIVLSCVTGLFMGIPLATESGITIIHYLDMVLGGAWWLLLLWIGHILAIFLVRGRPLTSDILVNDLWLGQTFSAFIAFAWNFLLPIGMIFLCIMEYRVSNSNSLFNWKHGGYWPLWARQIGGFIQVAFLLLVPVVTVIQIYRYLSKGPPDILDRFDLLLRPTMGSRDGTSNGNNSRMQYTRRPAPPLPVRTINSGSTMISLESRPPQDDAPPKYTPPPSYTTATGARIAKMLRNSIRRSVRRIIGESSGNRQRAPIPVHSSANPAGDELPPPDYSTILSNHTLPSGNTVSLPPSGLEMGPRVLYNSETLSGRRRHRSLTTGNGTQHQLPQQNLTANDVLQILRPVTSSHNSNAMPADEPSSLNRTPSFAVAATAAIGYGNVDLVVRNSLSRRHSVGGSVENLVLGAAPIGDSSIITLAVDDNDDDYARNDAERRRNGNDSVI
ncbi:sodium-dependent transporter bedraggled-like [Armigeres subalbatus]|uniref:sodium-dependent transporter bedraggled-like n=1 Tax=Armigeres subalbatus TaxID=124917 RepID=UPI002ED3AF15